MKSTRKFIINFKRPSKNSIYTHGIIIRMNCLVNWAEAISSWHPGIEPCAGITNKTEQNKKKPYSKIVSNDTKHKLYFKAEKETTIGRKFWNKWNKKQYVTQKKKTKKFRAQGDRFGGKISRQLFAALYHLWSYALQTNVSVCFICDCRTWIQYRHVNRLAVDIFQCTVWSVRMARFVQLYTNGHNNGRKFK